MSKSEVTGFAEFGPYKKFINGDLETYDGFFDGRKENIQFFFDETGMRRIGIYVYEGRDRRAAVDKWQQAYRSLEHLFGKVDTPAIARADSLDVPTDLGLLAIAAAANVEAVGKTQMAPATQPQDMFVFQVFIGIGSKTIWFM